jgi:hypothetical protein
MKKFSFSILNGENMLRRNWNKTFLQAGGRAGAA